MPDTMKALVLVTAEKAAEVREVPIPEPKPNELLVRVHAVALNPVDAVYVARPIAAQPERVVGSDFAGEVVRVPDALRGSADPRLRVGARVAGFLQGGEPASLTPGRPPARRRSWLITHSVLRQRPPRRFCTVCDAGARSSVARP